MQQLLAFFHRAKEPAVLAAREMDYDLLEAQRRLLNQSTAIRLLELEQREKSA